ncbi:hypothetical protein HYALB_00007036 [Hymenoscyphus albidus]|uniref:Uncharacterized protein n=1 Tax=Hymenoscyphus albidus TaxID=595503 RepID=A0A9N9LTS5_9HELO|nr:hypothetical protein HYALB_00007036 [Hymenoscyphus albidus]
MAKTKFYAASYRFPKTSSTSTARETRQVPSDVLTLPLCRRSKVSLSGTDKLKLIPKAQERAVTEFSDFDQGDEMTSGPDPKTAPPALPPYRVGPIVPKTSTSVDPRFDGPTSERRHPPALGFWESGAFRRFNVATRASILVTDPRAFHVAPSRKISDGFHQQMGWIL